VPGAQPLLLHGHGDRAGQLVAERGDGLPHLLAAVPEHHDELLGIELGDCVHRVTEQAASPDRVEDLGYGRAHPGALARGEDDDGGGTSGAHARGLLARRERERGALSEELTDRDDHLRGVLSPRTRS